MILRKWFTLISCITCSSAALAQPAPLPPTNMAAPATTLPPITLPAASAAAPAQNPGTALPPTNTAPSVAPTAEKTEASPLPLAPLTDERPFGSMGKSSISIFFTPLQIGAMKDALQEYESKPTAKVDPNLEINALPDKKEDIKLIEPDIYPVFYLSSIVYHSPKDWSIWVSGHKITSDTNKTDLTVLSVNESQASFAWKPKFNKAIKTRKEKNIFAPVEAELKNKLTPKPNYNYNAEEGVVTFTLRTNQTFVVAYMNTFEGFVSSPKLPALPVETKQDTSEPITEASTALQAQKSLSDRTPEIGTRPLLELLKKNPPTNETK